MFNLKKILLLMIFCMISLTACFEAPDKEAEKWEGIEKSSKNTEVNIVYYSDLDFESWIQDYFSPAILEKKKIRLTCEKSKLPKILPRQEEIAGKTSNGRYDIILIAKDDYLDLNAKGIMYPSFVTKLPNYNKYISHNDYANTYIDLEPIQDNAICFYQRQVSFFYNSDLMSSPPKDLDELMEYAQENPGTLIFPDPETEEGKLFFQSVILNTTDNVEFMEKDLSKQEVVQLALPGLRYLKNINRYLYAGGSMFPMDMEVIDELFYNEKIHMSISLDPMHGDYKLRELEYPDYVKSFHPFDLIASTGDYYAIIPVNSDNKSGAMVVLNEFLSPETQVSFYSESGLGGVPVYSKSSLDKTLSAKMDEEFKKKTMEQPSGFVKRKIGHIPEKYWKIILNEWKKMR